MAVLGTPIGIAVVDGNMGAVAGTGRRAWKPSPLF